MKILIVEDEPDIQELLSAHKEKGETVFSGADAFKLYDTFGLSLIHI